MGIILSNHPFFSVIVPLYNKKDFIVETIMSVLSQDFTSIEVIVLDDGSTDRSLEQLDHIKDGRLIRHRQVNRGVSAARNQAIALASGDFVCFLDADDIWSKNHLTVIYSLIKLDPRAIAWATGYTVFDRSSELNCSKGYDVKCNEDACLIDATDFYRMWFVRPFFWTGSICISRRRLLNMGVIFPEGENNGEDQDLWFRLIEAGPIRFMPTIDTAFYRVNVAESLTSILLSSPVPCFIRLHSRLNAMSKDTRYYARRVYVKHVLSISWGNLIAGRRKICWSNLRSVNPFVLPLLWIRILLFIPLPLSLVDMIRSWKRGV